MTPVQETRRFGKVTPATEAELNGSIHVELFAVVDGLEKRVYGYAMNQKHETLAKRLIRAWEAKAFAKQLTKGEYAPSAGKTAGDFYVSTDSENGDYMPLGRTLNADLKRLGF